MLLVSIAIFLRCRKLRRLQRHSIYASAYDATLAADAWDDEEREMEMAKPIQLSTVDGMVKLSTVDGMVKRNDFPSTTASATLDKFDTSINGSLASDSDLNRTIKQFFDVSSSQGTSSDSIFPGESHPVGAFDNDNHSYEHRNPETTLPPEVRRERFTSERRDTQFSAICDAVINALNARNSSVFDPVKSINVSNDASVDTNNHVTTSTAERSSTEIENSKLPALDCLRHSSEVSSTYDFRLPALPLDKSSVKSLERSRTNFQPSTKSRSKFLSDATLKLSSEENVAKNVSQSKRSVARHHSPRQSDIPLESNLLRKVAQVRLNELKCESAASSSASVSAATPTSELNTNSKQGIRGVDDAVTASSSEIESEEDQVLKSFDDVLSNYIDDDCSSLDINNGNVIIHRL